LDMIGRPRLLDRKQLAWPKKLGGIPDSTAVGVLGTDSSPELAGIARAVSAAGELPMFAPEDFGMLRDTIKRTAGGRSDHGLFGERAIQWLCFSSRETAESRRPTDTGPQGEGESLRRIARAVYRVGVAIDAADARATFVRKAD